MAKKTPKDGDKKKNEDWVLQQHMISAIRRLFRKSPMAAACLNEGKREKVTYRKDGSISNARRVEVQCACCGNWFSTKEVQVDHMEPVVDIETGFVDWNTYIDRMMCGVKVFKKGDPCPKTLQKLCVVCHKAKSKSEVSERAKVRRDKKAKLSR